LDNLNLLEKISKFNSIKYNFDGNIKIYFPDFFISELNLVIEVKSDYYYFKHLKKNIAKRKATLEMGFNYIIIVNKDYQQFNEKYILHE
jgi:very-short-patch-repair endonuclease